MFLDANRDSQLESRKIAELMQRHFTRYSKDRVRISTDTMEAGFFKNYDRLGERHIQKVFSGYKCDYLMFMRKIGNNDRSLQLWSSDLELYNIYIDYNDNMKAFLSDIAVNCFLTLLYDAEDRFWENRMY
ncbi:MAG: hypothetical protein ACQERN_04850 [Thermodesulfobacteriota bacterium]